MRMKVSLVKNRGKYFRHIYSWKKYKVYQGNGTNNVSFDAMVEEAVEKEMRKK